MAKPALGRGLSALLGSPASSSRPAQIPDNKTDSTPSTPSGESGLRVSIDRVRPSPNQPRKDFEPVALEELSESIKTQGILQPLLVRRKADGFEIIAGERRWRAAQLAGLKEVPVLVRDADDRSLLELALIENLQRENLNPIEEALGYAELIEKFHLRQEDAAAKVGRSRAAVANALRLLKLPGSLQDHVRHGRLSTGHAKALLALTDPLHQERAAAQVIAGGLSVRQTEALAADLLKPQAEVPSTGSNTAPIRDPHLVAIEAKLRERFGTKVRLTYSKGKGALEVRFFSDDDLQRILDLVGVSLD
ncbi:MAG: ParB/RepB/Spo0J family partition protein [Verrucomicrobia bacterium]|nr:ParB/RepB/Spo0J family partition protein [Verrucomicrobiota bacterium]